MLKGFTLLELIVVVVILGVLATLGVSQYTAARENALNNEARANLKLILSAERVYRMEQGAEYVSAADVGQVNSRLHLLLPSGGNRLWNYRVTSTGTSFCAQATRTTNGRTFSINSPTVGVADPQVVENGVCP